MRRAFSVGVLPVSCALACLLLAAPGRAQTPPAAAAAVQATEPVTGFVSAYEIAKIAAQAGFDPLAPPLREGTTYVLRATDYRGILMRVVIDARTGAIRDANRIVPGPGRYGQYGMMSPYDPADFDDAPDLEPPTLRPPTGYAPPATLAPPSRAGAIASPPLPRPRPAALKPPIGSEVSTAAPSPPPAPPRAAAPKPAAVEPLND